MTATIYTEALVVTGLVVTLTQRHVGTGPTNTTSTIGATIMLRVQGKKIGQYFCLN